MSLPPIEGDKDKELFIPGIQDKGLSVKRRVFNSLVLLLEVSFVVAFMYLAGMVFCALLDRWLGSCVC